MKNFTQTRFTPSSVWKRGSVEWKGINFTISALSWWQWCRNTVHQLFLLVVNESLLSFQLRSSSPLVLMDTSSYC